MSGQEIRATGMPNWTEENRNTLEAMWRAGQTSSSIAKELDTTRSAIMGKVRRMGLTGMQPKKPADEKKPPRPMRLEPVVVDAHRPRPLIELRRTACRYPVTPDNQPPGDHLFCARRAQENSPYCPEHHRLCYSQRARS
jgi:hypothetical protein